jgi:hypothetical protein
MSFDGIRSSQPDVSDRPNFSKWAKLGSYLASLRDPRTFELTGSLLIMLARASCRWIASCSQSLDNSGNNIFDCGVRAIHLPTRPSALRFLRHWLGLLGMSRTPCDRRENNRALGRRTRVGEGRSSLIRHRGRVSAPAVIPSGSERRARRYVRCHMLRWDPQKRLPRESTRGPG